MARLIITVLSLFLISSVISQKNNDLIWEALYKNDRKLALDLTSKIKFQDASMEELILKKNALMQNGVYKTSPKFMDYFLKQENAEYFLFPLWNENYIFKDYLTQGVDKDVSENIKKVRELKMTNSTMIASFTYLDYVSKRAVNDFKTYRTLNTKLKSITNWQYCGVFENLNKSGMNIIYPPETTPVSSQPFNANSNGYVNWFTPSFNKTNAYQFMSNYKEYGSGVNYAQTFFNLEEEQTLIFKLGIGRATKLWLNDVLIFEETEDHVTEMDAHIIKVKVPKGNNRILLKTINDSYSYFILRVFDEDNNLLDPNEIGFTDKYEAYTKSSAENLEFEKLPQEIEYFITHLNPNEYSEYLKDYLLIKTYLRNFKEKEAKVIIYKYLDKYPKSSLLKIMLSKCYIIENDNAKVNEIYENIKQQDPENVEILISEVADVEKLFNMPIDQMNESLDKIAAASDIELIKKTTEFLKYIRTEDKKKFKKVLDELVEMSLNQQNENLISLYATFYSKLFNDDKRTLKLLTDVNSDYVSVKANNSLIDYYYQHNELNKVIDLDKDFVKKFPEELSFLKSLIIDLQSFDRYQESIEYIDKGLEISPYSFKLMNYKGDAYLQTGQEQKALEWFKKSYSHDSGNSSLRRKIHDIEKTEDPIDKLIKDDYYQYISDHRGKTKTEINYGLNILYNESNVQIFKEGGNKSHSVFLYEITSENGIEKLKEYSLGLQYGYNIIKSEIVKPDGTIVPAERSYSNFVFNNLSIDDVIFIEYETFTNKTGRFYKDYNKYTQLEYYYPNPISINRVILPKGKNINYAMPNGTIEPLITEDGEFTIYEWSRENDNRILDKQEDFMPSESDYALDLRVSTIDDWNQIATWYSDLVSSQIQYNSTVNGLYDTLFPKGIEGLSETERATTIYYYMMNNLTYSFVSFKQSGFVPQKPSKTITSKLGDCKDFSTLFLAIAKKAKLETNLVLVSTSNLGAKYLVLPSRNFNHCIVKVVLEGKDQYIELTDKYLPFLSTPTSLIGAQALIIPESSSTAKDSELFKLFEGVKTNNIRQLDVKYTISNDSQVLNVKNRSVNNNAYYRELLEEQNSEILDEDMEQVFEKNSKLDLTLLDFEIIKNEKEDPEVIFVANFTVDKDINRVGKMKLLELPQFSLAYTQSIINLEERKYPIHYLFYERNDMYLSNYDIVLEDNQVFVEVPQNVDLKYKAHHFTIEYILNEAKTQLTVNVTAKVDRSDIMPEEYLKYKEFVKQVLEATEILIGFK